MEEQKQKTLFNPTATEQQESAKKYQRYVRKQMEIKFGVKPYEEKVWVRGGNRVKVMSFNTDETHFAETQIFRYYDKKKWLLKQKTDEYFVLIEKKKPVKKLKKLKIISKEEMERRIKSKK